MSPENQILHFVYTSDERYVLVTEVSILSAYAKASRPRDLVVHVLDCGIPDAAWAAFQARVLAAAPLATLSRHRVDTARFAALRLWKGSSVATYARLCTASLLPELEWCVFVDGDTLFLDDPMALVGCYDKDLALKGFPDTQAFKKPAMAWYRRPGNAIDPERYVCCGFMAMNLAWFRAHGVEERCLAFLRRNPDAPTVDQDALNIVCRGHIGALPDGWGAYVFLNYTARADVRRPIDRYKCIHYTGLTPWRPIFLWRIGYHDIAAVWVCAATTLRACPIRAVTGLPAWRWRLGRAYTRLAGAAVRLRARFPLIGRKVSGYKRLFFTKAERRRFLTPAFWRG